MLSDITLGQFFPGSSIIHKTDSRIKLVITMLLLVIMFLAKNALSLGLAICTAAVLVFATKVPFKLYFKGLKAIWVLIIFTSVLNIFYVKGTHIIFSWKFITVTAEGLILSGFITARLVCLILISCALTYTTSPTDLTDALERLLSPLKLFKVRVHELAMMMTIALRFIPTLLEETGKIMQAQKARGADLESGNIIQRAKALIPILIPLFVSSFRRAFDLAVAMECRCYKGGDGRTKMKVLKMKASDYAALLVTFAIGTAIVLLNRIDMSIFSI